MNENAGIVEPYELSEPVLEPVLEPALEPVLEPMLEPLLEPVLEPVLEPAAPVTDLDLSGYNYDIVLTYKMIEDTDDQDTLFRIQFLQAFGITDDEYHPEIVSAVIDDLYERFRENPGIREILESHPLAAADNSEMIFCMMFSFQIFDLFHACMRYAKHGEDIPQILRGEIADCLRQMF